MKNIRRYLTNNLAYGDSGHRDREKQMEDVVIMKRQGRLHFIRFPTQHMPPFLELAKQKGMAETLSTVCATGGGAHKFEEDIKRELNMTLHKFDELDSLVGGIEFIEAHNPKELYYWQVIKKKYFQNRPLQDPGDDQLASKQQFDFTNPFPFLLVNIGSGVNQSLKTNVEESILSD